MNTDVAEAHSGITVQHGIMVSGNVVDFSAVAGSLKDKIDNSVIDFRPMPSSGKTMKIEYVADKVQIVRVCILEKIKEPFALNVLAAKMGV